MIRFNKLLLVRFVCATFILEKNFRDVFQKEIVQKKIYLKKFLQFLKEKLFRIILAIFIPFYKFFLIVFFAILKKI